MERSGRGVAVEVKVMAAVGTIVVDTVDVGCGAHEDRTNDTMAKM